MIKGLPRPPLPSETVALDLEIYKMGKRLHRPTGMFACLSIAYSADEVYQVYDLADLAKSMEILDGAQWVFHNSLFDLSHLRRWVRLRRRPVWDTLLVEADIFGGYYDEFGLDDLTRRWLRRRLPKDTRSVFAVTETMTPEMEQYAANDAVATIQIQDKQADYLKQNVDDLRCYWEIDEPAVWAAMDMKPIRVDVDGWLLLAEEHTQTAERIKNELGFNPGSPVQTKKALGALLGRAPNDTRAETLKGIREGDYSDKSKGLSHAITEYRTYKKAASSYGKKWIEDNVEEGDLVYSGWRITGAETGRMSSRNPNLQNIPSRKMPKFRSLFKPLKGEVLIVADVAAQEPRIAAWWSKDEVLLYTLALDEDVYAPVMGSAGVSRDDAKTIFLGLLYDLSEHGLAARLHCTKNEAKALMQKVLGKLRGIAIWKHKAKSQAYQREYALTPTGRKVWLNLYNPQWERNAVNAPIQGGAADMTKKALGRLHEQPDFNVAMVVHDEIVASCPIDTAEAYAILVRDAWVEAGRVVIPGVPVRADVKTGADWGIKQSKAEDYEGDEE